MARKGLFEAKISCSLAHLLLQKAEGFTQGVTIFLDLFLVLALGRHLCVCVCARVCVTGYAGVLVWVWVYTRIDA